MLNKWLGLALLGLSLGLGTQAKAQYLPRPVGAARLPDPAPINGQGPPAAVPNLVEGPITPQLAPPGPGANLTLSEEHSSAFQAVEPENTLNLQFSFGAIGLKRQGVGSNPISVLDNTVRPLGAVINVPVPSDVIVLNGRGVNFPVPTDVAFQMLGFPDDGRNPPAGSPFLGNFGDLRTGMAWGPRLGVMLVGENTALELNGFILGKQSASTTITSPFLFLNSSLLLQNIATPVASDPNTPVGFPRPTPPNAVIGTTVTVTGDPLAEVAKRLGPQFSELDLPFFNAPNGFQGNNNLWRNADLVSLRFQTELSNYEGNIRYWTNVGSPCEGIVGIRYLQHMESLDYTTVDDFFQDVINPNPVLPGSTPVFNVSGGPGRRVGDPTVTATYRTRVENRVIGPQLGFEGHLLPFNWLALSYSAKAMAGVNLLDRQVSLTRGDGFSGFRTEEKLQRFAHAYELNFNADVSLLECCHLRAGYNLFWLVDVATAVGQIDYDLSHTAGRRNSSDSVLYQGPSIELQFVF